MKAKSIRTQKKDARIRKQSMRIVWIMIISVILCIGAYVAIKYRPVNANPPKVGFAGPKSMLGKPYVKNLTFKAPPYYWEILKTKATKKVDINFTEVHLFTYMEGEIQWLGTGTSYIDNSDGKEYILTVGHLFDIDFVGTNIFLFCDINDPEGRCYGIDHITKSDEVKRSGDMPSADSREVDAAICRKGLITLIPGYSHIVRDSNSTEEDVFSESDKPSLVLTSLVSGISYPMLGVGHKLGKPGQKTIPFLVFDYQSKPGESGTGFIGSDKAVYVLMGSLGRAQYSMTGLKREPLIGATRAMMFNFNW